MTRGKVKTEEGNRATKRSKEREAEDLGGRQEATKRRKKMLTGEGHAIRREEEMKTRREVYRQGPGDL